MKTRKLESPIPFYRPQTKFAKVMFLHVSVILSIGGVLSQHALQVVSQPCSKSPGGYPSMPCRFPGPHPGGKLRGIWPGGSPGPKPRGKLREIWPGGSPGPDLGGPAPREGLLPEGVPAPGGVWRHPPVMATAVGGTHPTGMHSCFKLVFLQCHNCLGGDVTSPAFQRSGEGKVASSY